MAFSTENICRTCMAESGTLIPIWPMNKLAAIDPSSSITVMLKSFTTIDALKGDGLPEHLCLTCISELNRAYSFKQKCERSEYTLRLYLEPPKSDVHQSSAEALVTCGTPVAETIIEAPTKKNVIIFFPKNATQPNHVATDTSLVYQCSSCSATFLSYESLKEHLIDQHDALHCAHCDMYFNADAYIAHKKIHSIDEAVKARPDREYACEICSLDFASKDIFDAHFSKFHVIEEAFEVLNDDGEPDVYEEITYDDYDELETINETEDTIHATKAENHSNDHDEKFHCTHCNATFAKKLSLNIHFNSRKCMQKSFQCDICERVFAKKKYLSAHMEEHAMKPELECALCNLVFMDEKKDDYNEHMRTVHSKTRKFKCDICTKSFGMSSTLKDHMRTHSGERPYLCSVCGKGFTQNANLKQHLMRHNKMKPFKCNVCGHAFVSKGELETHERKHTGQHPFVCDICGSGFTTSSSMGKHKRIHTGERPYACEHCPMRFSALATLKNHRRTHTGERPFKCSHCSRSFTQKSDCVTHMRTHTGERPYVCTVCNQTFSHGSSLKSHMKSHRKIAKTGVQSEKNTETFNTSDSLILVDVI